MDKNIYHKVMGAFEGLEHFVVFTVSLFTLFYMAIVMAINDKEKNKKAVPKWMTTFISGVQPMLLIGSIIATLASGYEVQKSL